MKPQHAVAAAGTGALLLAVLAEAEQAAFQVSGLSHLTRKWGTRCSSFPFSISLDMGLKLAELQLRQMLKLSFVH